MTEGGGAGEPRGHRQLCDGLDDDCNGQVDEGSGTCNNVAPLATAAVNPGGGSISPYDPPQMSNGVDENCGGCAWMNDATGSAGWATLT